MMDNIALWVCDTCEDCLKIMAVLALYIIVQSLGFDEWERGVDLVDR